MHTTTAATILGVLMLVATRVEAAAPVCGDVNNSNSVSSTDALLVLRKGVGQSVVLDCSAYDQQFGTCESSLSQCNTDLTACHTPSCGNSIIENSEECDKENLGGKTCLSVGAIGGTLGCFEDCQYDSTHCFFQRFDDSGATIVDHLTGLQWEKKNSFDGSVDYSNPHDADNVYTWHDGGAGSVVGTTPDGTVFTTLLPSLNTAVSTDGTKTHGCYAGHCDWRLPTVEDLETIRTSFVCNNPPCVIDPVFANTRHESYWSLSTYAPDLTYAWTIAFEGVALDGESKINARSVRAVRGGSAGTVDSACPSGYSSLSACWFLGLAGDSCDQACAEQALVYSEHTANDAGSFGTAQNCENLLDALGAPGSGLQFPSLSSSIGLGCSANNIPLRARVDDPETTSSASQPDVLRVCACK